MHQVFLLGFGIFSCFSIVVCMACCMCWKCCGVGVCFCDCCFYVVKYRCLVFVISVGGECFYFTVCFSRFLFVEYSECG